MVFPLFVCSVSSMNFLSESLFLFPPLFPPHALIKMNEDEHAPVDSTNGKDAAPLPTARRQKKRATATGVPPRPGTPGAAPSSSSTPSKLLDAITSSSWMQVLQLRSLPPQELRQLASTVDAAGYRYVASEESALSLEVQNTHKTSSSFLCSPPPLLLSLSLHSLLLPIAAFTTPFIWQRLSPCSSSSSTRTPGQSI